MSNSKVCPPCDPISEGISVSMYLLCVIYYSYVCDNNGERLISKFDFSDQGYKIRLSSKWVKNFYPLDQSIEDGNMIGYETNFYATMIL